MTTITDIFNSFFPPPKKVILTGKTLTIPEIISVSRNQTHVSITPDPKIRNRIKKCYQKMIMDVKNGIPIYGTNTGFGGRAGNVANIGNAKTRLKLAQQISEGITHIDVSVGPLFDTEITRAAMLIRINMLLQGVSAVKLKDLEIYQQMLNSKITPLVHQYGGIGASGDLAHNCRILNAARGLPGIKVIDNKGNIKEAKHALLLASIPLLKLDPKAGLGLVNGDNYSTALAALLSFDTLNCLMLSSVLGAITIEVLKGSDRSFHPLLAKVRPHPGQIEVASLYRYLLKDSKLAYHEMKGHFKRPQGIKVQDPYSLRCIAQYHGVNFEKLIQSFEIITRNANSVSDNPLWVAPEYVTLDETPWNWVSGGNFIASHMVEVIDGLRKTMTQIIKLNDRHLARLVNPYENNGLPANLSDDKAITKCAFKGIQIQSGMFDVYSSLLSIPVSTFFGVHEEGNQDITSHALTSGILALENLRLLHYSLAQNLIAVSQAVDLRGGPSLLSPRTKPLYQFIRQRVSYVTKERPLHGDIENIYQSLLNGELTSLLKTKVFADLK